jgi:hypothetical protein
MKPEERLHRDIADYLTLTLGGCAWFTTIPLGGGGRLRGAILNGMGVKAGVPDILIVDGGRAYWLEVKSAKGRVSPEQRQCHDVLALARAPVTIVRSLEDVERALTRWGVPLKARIAACPGGSRASRD